MIGGLVVDLVIVLGAIAAFAWAGQQLGGRASIGRTLAGVVACCAVLASRDPAGAIVARVLPGTTDVANLVGVLVVGTATYVAANRVWRWWISRRDERVADDLDTGEVDVLDRPGVAIAASAASGVLWAILFVALLVLLPSDNALTRSAARSVTGSALITQGALLRWIDDGFPHFTQTLPKGRLGAVVGERALLPMHGDEPARSRRADTEVLLRQINRYRRSIDLPALVYNPNVARVAKRHAVVLAADKTLSYRTPGGARIEPQVLAALGESAAMFDDQVGTEVVWAHAPDHALRAMRDDRRARRLLRDERWSEVGIGAATTGWFNGTVYVVLLVGPSDANDSASVVGGETGM